MTGTTIVDPVQYKATIRREWRDAAPGWRAWVDVLEAEEAGGAVSRTLVQLAGIGPGDVVLDVAAGYGEPGRPAARAVAPGGHVVCTDSPLRCWRSAASGRLPRGSTTSSSLSVTLRSWRSRRAASTRC